MANASNEFPLIDVSDVETRLGRELDPHEQARAESLIDDVSAMVRTIARTEWIDPFKASTTAVPAAVRAVIANRVANNIHNPDGLKSETAGVYTYQRAAVNTGALLTSAEENIIRRAAGHSPAWTQPTTRTENASCF
ncbi:Gp19/Gp15/Gp42 family protein [Pseudonocardia halophobica]|uniref:Gp19/Gp15/Gp42 family protein n=1 Tax=Pseudonocardia halophobica TaxID=29401 RepID=UPI003D94CE60